MEVWKDIQGYEGYYQISNLGNVYSVRFKRYRKLRKDKCGYMVVSLNKEGKQQPFFVHRLVASAFIENPNSYLEVNHIDGNKENNHINNLEWCDRLGNMKHAFSTGLMPNRVKKVKPKKKKEQGTKLTLEIVQQIRSEHIPGKRGNGCKALAKKYGVSDNTIKSIINKKIWREA